MAIPETFKAALVTKSGAENTITDRSLPPLETGEVGIKITATAINPVDWKLREISGFLKEFPLIFGTDAAGEIAALGPGVSYFAVGDCVFFQGIIYKNNFSTFQQYCKMPTHLLARTPSSVTDEQGYGMSAPWDEGGDKAGNGKAVVILGGSSSVGQYAFQMAKLSGFEKIVTNSSAEHIEFLKGLGADVVLERGSKDATEDFVAAIGDLPLAFVYDAISAKATQAQGVKILQAANAKDSCVVTVLPADSEAEELGKSHEPKVAVKAIWGAGSDPNLLFLSEPLMKHLGGEEGWIAKGRFVPNRTVVVPGGLGALEATLAKNKEGISGRKFIIKPSET
ncbi:Uu.00g067810.m01.CDS01 [Anthostomella pinea]|uniref:Uu.00g067810.m01.CDS01 n=1 Tax=Anthostomella pinea TaxID=933095 RepID=A0AAI8VNL5_9PEZI|nr:Uu.00g067810.m01.CDS01 [Anthostomella pinea]